MLKSNNQIRIPPTYFSKKTHLDEVIERTNVTNRRLLQIKEVFFSFDSHSNYFGNVNGCEDFKLN